MCRSCCNAPTPRRRPIRPSRRAAASHPAAIRTLTFAFATGKDGNTIAVSYLVAGYIDGGLEKIAPGVDHVIGQQLQSLRRFADAGAASK